MKKSEIVQRLEAIEKHLGIAKEEPKVGDIVKVWDAKEGKFFIGTLYKKGIYDVPYPIMVKLYNSRDDYNFYGNAEKITKQEAIDLLFK